MLMFCYRACALLLAPCSLLQNDDLDDLELTARVASPSDGSVEISSEKVDQGELSSIDGYDSKNDGYDLAVAFEGDSDYVRVDLTVSGRGVEWSMYHCNILVSYGVACWDVKKVSSNSWSRAILGRVRRFIDRLIILVWHLFCFLSCFLCYGYVPFVQIFNSLKMHELISK